jgi:hypothetical protein
MKSAKVTEVVHGDNRLESKDDIDNNRITISRDAGASIWGYTFVGTDGASPGIPLRKEAFLGQESQEKLQKYVAIHLQFRGPAAHGEFTHLLCTAMIAT